MRILGSLLVVILLAGVHVTIGRWRWLHGGERSPWLSVSAGAALAYVFVHLLPKLAVTQDKLLVILSDQWTPILRNQTYLIALAGLVCFFWLAWADDKLDSTGGALPGRSRRRELLHVGGYGLYSLQIGLLVAQLPTPDPLSYLLAAAVLGLHLMGVDHGVRKHDPSRYEGVLRWMFAGALLLGWLIGILTDRLDTLFLLLNAFIAGGIIITAIREELPTAQQTRFLPFVAGVVGVSAAILIIQVTQASATAGQ